MVSGFDRRPTQYVRDKTAVTVDLTEVWIGTIVAVIAASAFIAVVALPRDRHCLKKYGAILVSIAFGALILLANFAYGWDTDSVSTTTLYSPFNEEIDCDIGLHVGLRGINITLRGTPEVQLNETIDYNERFRWDWAQGRFGFGEAAGRISQEYRRALDAGVPLPIVWVAEYFTLDGERIRWGRYYRLAGYYTHAVLWVSFILWFMMVATGPASPEVSTVFMLACGVSLITACITWTAIKPNDLVIPFEHGVLKPEVSWTFWLVLFMGVFTIIPGIINASVLYLQYKGIACGQAAPALPPRQRVTASTPTSRSSPNKPRRKSNGRPKSGRSSRSPPAANPPQPFNV